MRCQQRRRPPQRTLLYSGPWVPARTYGQIHSIKPETSPIGATRTIGPAAKRSRTWLSCHCRNRTPATLPLGAATLHVDNGGNLDVCGRENLGNTCRAPGARADDADPDTVVCTGPGPCRSAGGAARSISNDAGVRCNAGLTPRSPSFRRSPRNDAPEYRPAIFHFACKSFILYGERGRNRTYNLLIKRQCTGVV